MTALLPVDVAVATAPETERLKLAADLLEQALKAGRTDAAAAYMLGMAYKGLGKRSDARAAFRKIAAPDANVVLQLGLLSFAEKQYAQAEQEFSQAWQLDPHLFAAGYNLLLSQLCQAKVNDSLPVVKRLEGLASTREDKAMFALLALLLEKCQLLSGNKPPPLPGALSNGTAAGSDSLGNIRAADEERLLNLLLGLGQMEAAFPLLRTLALSRPHSVPAQEAFAKAVLLHAKKHADRCNWEAAEHLLVPLATSFSAAQTGAGNVSVSLQLATYTLLGCCECMLQEFTRAISYFSWATKLSASDPWIHQNLALAHELRGQLDEADSHWNRYFELQSRAPVPDVPNYREVLAFEGLSRLAETFTKKERWNTALTYLQRASRMRPNDLDALERLFHAYNQVKRPEDARKILKRLQELRPGDPQLELYELDLREVKTLEDIDRMLGDIRKTLNRYPNDARVDEKAVALVQNVIPLIGRMCDQYTEQLHRVMEQVRKLPNYQINWSAVHDVARDLHREFQKLRRIANRCLGLVSSEENRRVIRELMQHIDRKVEVCQSLGH
jgi:tetratricopeptide (TPR) repeat protein